MKKALSLLLVLVLCLSLCACGGTNIEKFCDGYDIKWDGYEGQHNNSVKYYALFKDGTLTITKYVPNTYSTGGKWKVAETKEYSYELQGNDTVIIDGETYTYEISDDRVSFNKELVGIESWWKR